MAISYHDVMDLRNMIITLPTLLQITNLDDNSSIQPNSHIGMLAYYTLAYCILGTVFYMLVKFHSTHRIIGLYVSVVLVIGSALRSYVSSLPGKIKIDEIPDPDSLLELCEDIFYVREDGQLQEEEILVGRLFFIFRSSSRLIHETRWKQD